MKTAQKRNYGIDLVKILAAALVISVHHFATIGFYKVEFNGGFTMILSTALYVVSLSCVPLFLISTGYLLYGRTIDKEHYVKISFFLLEVFFIYLFGIALALIVKGAFSIHLWLDQVIQKMLSPSYYVGLYFSLYLMVPFFNLFFKSLEDYHKKIFLIVTIFVISLPVALNFIFSINFFDVRPASVWAVMYYFIGVSIRHFQPKISKWLSFLGVVLFSFLYAFILSYYLSGKTYSHILGYYQNIFLVSISTLIFLFLYDIKIKRLVTQKIIIVLSSSTLTFYLFSGMFSDYQAMRKIKLSGTLLYDLSTVFPKVIFSMLYSLPISILVYSVMKALKKIRY